LQLSNDIASNDNNFSAFETHFLGSITQGFKEERETKSKFLNIASAPVIEVDAEAMFNNSTIQYRNKMKANRLGFYTSDIYTQADALPPQQHPSISTIHRLPS
jgi:hypothetical protein